MGEWHPVIHSFIHSWYLVICIIKSHLSVSYCILQLQAIQWSKAKKEDEGRKEESSFSSCAYVIHVCSNKQNNYFTAPSFGLRVLRFALPPPPPSPLGTRWGVPFFFAYVCVFREGKGRNEGMKVRVGKKKRNRKRRAKWPPSTHDRPLFFFPKFGLWKKKEKKK